MAKLIAVIYKKEDASAFDFFNNKELPPVSVGVKFEFNKDGVDYAGILIDKPSHLIYTECIKEVADKIVGRIRIQETPDDSGYKITIDVNNTPVVNLETTVLKIEENHRFAEWLSKNFETIIGVEVIDDALSVPTEATVFINALGKVFGKVTENLKEMDDYLSKFLTSLPAMKLLYHAMEEAMRSLFEGGHSEYFLEHLEKYCTEKERNEFWNAQCILRLNGMSHILVHRGEVIYFESNRKFSLYHEELVNGTAIY